MIFVLDASAMIAYLRDEPGAPEVEGALLADGSRCYAHVLNLCEVFYDFHRAGGTGEALAAITDLSRVGVIQRRDMIAEFWQSASALKSVYRRVSLADCFGIALAQKLGATFLTADHHEMDSLARQSVCGIRFIR